MKQHTYMYSDDMHLYINYMLFYLNCVIDVGGSYAQLA